MAMTLIEWAKTATLTTIRRGIIETLYTEEPVFQYVPFRNVASLALGYTAEQALPGVAFRKFNAAFTATTGVVQRMTENLKPFGGDSLTDKAFVDANGNEERVGRDNMFTKAMSLKYVQTFLYGNSPASRAGTAFDDLDGFDGIQARLTSGQIVDAGATTGADGSSVFAVRFGDGFCQGLQTPVGVDARDLGEQGSTEGPMLLTRIDQTAGLAIYHGQAVAAIMNASAASTVVTTTMMDELSDMIVGTPTIYIMSKRSRRQLKASAEAAGFNLNVTLDELGRKVPSWDGRPIIVSDAVIDTETNS